MGNTNGADRRGAAKAFVRRWRDRGDERQDTQAFWLDLLTSVFDMRSAAEVCRFEHPVKTMASDHTGYADLWVEPARLIVEQKGADIDLAKKEPRQGRMVTPAEQARDYANGIPLSQRPRYIVACNFREFWFYDLELDPQCRKPYLTVTLDQLPDNLAAFAMLKGGEEAQAVLTRQVSVEAGRIMGELHRLASEAYAATGADPDDPKVHHALAVLMTRLMFLLFCEDSGIIEADAFKDYLRSFKYENYQTALQDLFAWLDTEDEDRNPFAEERLRKFPYMNGGLYRERIFLPPLGENFAHTLLVNASQEFNWAGVSPTVFGSIFEGALSHDHRRANGQHFTSIENIHRVLDPLFLDELEREFDQACSKDVAGGARTKALGLLNDKLGTLVFLDPAAGSGNFLTEAYLSLRRLENRIFIELQRDADAYQAYMPGFGEDEGHNLDVTVSLANFHGIELEDYACCVARTALWIAEQQANIATQRITGRPYQALPLNDYEGVVCADALTTDWNDVVPPEKVTYVVGNPPFLGARNQTPEQKAEVMAIYDNAKGSGNNDFASAWFKKASDYTSVGHGRCALVSTNSICQGEQVANVWSPIMAEGTHIDFAWPTFVWDSQSDDAAHVHVVIVGFSREDAGPRRLYTADGARKVGSINAYLADAPDTFVWSRTTPLGDVPRMGIGNKPIDGGFYLFTDEEKAEFLAKEPGAAQYFHPWIGSREFINGYNRWVLWLGDAKPSDLLKLPLCRERVEAVRDFRLSSKSKPTVKLAETPTRFHVENMPEGTSVVIPEVSSQRRKYIPMGFVGPDTFCSNKVRLIPNATIYEYGVLQSLTHNAWMRSVTGRLKSDYQYSAKVVYNNFIWPDPTPNQKAEVERCAQAVLDARKAYDDCSLAQMYDPDNAWMFPDLISAHDALDAAVEAAYGVDFGGDEERIVSHLFALYAEAVGEGDR
jgi:hypothetical protein